MKNLTIIITGKDEGGNTYKHIRVQDFTFGKTKVTNTFFLNDVKVIKYDREWVKDWISNNSYSCKETVLKN